jgi:hypothetical protein
MAAKCIAEAIIIMQRGFQERQYCSQIPHFQSQEIHWRRYEAPQNVNGTYQNIAKNKMAAICITEAITMQRGVQERKYCCRIPHFQGQEIHWRLFETPLNVNKLTNLRFLPSTLVMYLITGV